MPDLDHDLIAALAEGRLDPEAARAAERAIAADPEAAALLAAQRRALDAIAAATPAALTETERSDLRASVAEAVGLELAPQATSRRRAPWAAISIAAASLAALVAVVPLANLLSNDAGDGSAVTLGVAEVDDVNRTASDPTGGDAESFDHGVQSEGTGMPSTTMAAAAPAEEYAALAQKIEELVASDEAEARMTPTEETACGDEASDHLDTPLDSLFYAELTLDDQQMLIFFTIADGKLKAAGAFAPGDCALLRSLP